MVASLQCVAEFSFRFLYLAQYAPVNKWTDDCNIQVLAMQICVYTVDIK